ncbi:MAG: T9SS type A sorting domain-containing protein [Bacteroidetes bacterium]|nr:T9SS type A sorting domain-containing protein [Bacteroidota bacterium]
MIKKLLSLCALATILGAGQVSAQIYYADLPSSVTGTSSNSKGPSAANHYQITEGLYTKTELMSSLAGAQIVGIGFTMPTTTLVSTPITGANIKVYLENTTDITNSKSTTWTTAVSTMSVCYNGTVNIPASGATATNVIVPFTTPFNYGGNGLYLAYEYTNTGTVSTNPNTYNCNTSLTPNGIRTAASATAMPTTLGAQSAFRPIITWYFQYNGVEVSVTEVDIASNKTVGNNYTYSVTLNNYGNAAATASTMTVTIDGMPTTLNAPAIAAGGSVTVNSNWMPMTPEKRSTFAIKTAYAGDLNPASDIDTVYEYAFSTLAVMKQDFNDTAAFKNISGGSNSAALAQLGGGWSSINNDGSTGTTTLGPWYISNAVFEPFDGNQSINDGYATANGVKIDDWLVSPLISSYCTANLDSLVFNIRSVNSAYVDSMEIRLAPNGGSTVSDFTVQVAYLNVPKTGWTKFKYNLNSLLPAGTTQYRVAFRYLMGNGGSTGANSDFIGIDGIAVNRTVATVNAAANVSVAGMVATFTNTSTGAVSYSWDFGDGQTSTAMSPANTYTATGTYTVTMVATNACSVTSTYTTVVNIITTNVADASSNVEFALMPNPAKDVVTLAVSAPAYHVEVMNMLGDVVYKQASVNSTTVLNIANLNNGAYFVKITLNDGRVSTKRLIINK